VLWQRNGLCSGINVPTQYGFFAAPAGVTGEEFLDGDGLLAMQPIVACQGVKDRVYGMEDVTKCMKPLLASALCGR